MFGISLLVLMAGALLCWEKLIPNTGAEAREKGGESAAENMSAEDQTIDSNTSNPVVLVEKANLKPKIIHRKFTGTFEPVQELAVVSRVAGNIEKQLFKEGDFIKEGTVLFEIEKIRYEAARDAARAEVASCEAQIATIKARRRQVNARLAYAKSNYERNKVLYEQQGNVVTKDTVENLGSILEAQEAELESINAEEMTANAGLDAAKAKLKLADDDMKHTTISAMISGRVGRINRDCTVGNYITPATGPLATIIQTDPIYLRFSMSEKDYLTLFGNLDNLRKFARIRVQLANDQFYDEKGTFAFVDNKMAAATNTINIWVSFSNSNGLLNPDGVAGIYLDKIENKMLPAIKESALLFDGRRHSVYIVGPDNIIEQRQVEPGPVEDERQTVISGLKEGETVVIDGTHKIRLIPGPNGKILPVTVRPVFKPTEMTSENDVLKVKEEQKNNSVNIDKNNGKDEAK